MKKSFVLLLSVNLLFFANCNSKAGKEIDKDDPEPVSKNDDNEDEEDSDFKKASIDYCECLTESYTDLDPQFKKLMIKTADTKDPAISLANELKKRDDEEYQALMSEIKSMATNSEAKACANKMKKQSGIDIDDDVDGLKKVLQIVENNEGSEFGVAMLKHSINSKERRHKREQQSREEE